jgi:hypothetical protein
MYALASWQAAASVDQSLLHALALCVACLKPSLLDHALAQAVQVSGSVTTAWSNTRTWHQGVVRSTYVVVDPSLQPAAVPAGRPVIFWPLLIILVSPPDRVACRHHPMVKDI